MQIEIRRAGIEDAERLSHIARAAKASWGYPTAALSEWEPILRMTPGYLRSGIVYAAMQDRDVVGFYGLEQRGDRWMLEHLWVEPRWQGRGVGRRLFEHALEKAGAAGPGILVIEADPHAAGFYARMGARETGSLAAPLEGEPGRRLPVFEVNMRRVRGRCSAANRA